MGSECHVSVGLLCLFRSFRDLQSPTNTLYSVLSSAKGQGSFSYIAISGLSMQSIGATSSSSSQSLPCYSHSCKKRLHSCHYSRYHQQHAPEDHRKGERNLSFQRRYKGNIFSQHNALQQKNFSRLTAGFNAPPFQQLISGNPKFQRTLFGACAPVFVFFRFILSSDPLQNSRGATSSASTQS